VSGTVPVPIDLEIDVTEAAGLGEPCHTAVTAFLPDPDALAEPPVVCFAFPGGGYSRGYFSFDMPDANGRHGQAGFHAARGWVFVAVDHLGVGDSTVPSDDGRVTYEVVARVNAAAVEAVMARLEGGSLVAGFPRVRDAVRLGIGQSMGGCFLLVTQGQHGVFDGIGVLGFSAIHTSIPSRPGLPDVAMPWIPRGTDLSAPIVLNAAALAAASSPVIADETSLADAATQPEHPFRWAFHYDDEPADVVERDLGAGLDGNPLPEWRSGTTPACAIFMVAPGTVAAEAAAVRVPVLVAAGERDVVPDPWLEPKFYESSDDVTVFVCRRMAHMHNFATTRETLWARLHAWGRGVAELREHAA
jgi:pimeloyl-ACP methyl ester carboxylesterase